MSVQKDLQGAELKTPADESSAEPLSTGARLLFSIIRERARTRGYCFACQLHLADQVGKCPRMTRYYLRELQAAGEIIIKRRGRKTAQIIPRGSSLFTTLFEWQPIATQEEVSSGNPLPLKGGFEWQPIATRIATQEESPNIGVNYVLSRGRGSSSAPPTQTTQTEAVPPKGGTLIEQAAKLQLDIIARQYLRQGGDSGLLRAALEHLEAELPKGGIDHPVGAFRSMLWPKPGQEWFQLTADGWRRPTRQNQGEQRDGHRGSKSQTGRNSKRHKYTPPADGAD